MKRAWLKDVPLFAELAGNDDFIDSVARALTKRPARKGDVIITKGDIGQEMYFIIRGEAEVLSTLDSDDNTPLAKLSAKSVAKSAKVGSLGSFFGEDALLSGGGKRNAYVRATKNMQLYVLGKVDLDAVLESFPAVEGILKASMEKRKESGVAGGEDDVYASMRPFQLRDLCKERGLPEVGGAAELRATLRAAEAAAGAAVAKQSVAKAAETAPAAVPATEGIPPEPQPEAEPESEQSAMPSAMQAAAFRL
jgi:F-box/leucine-rich repeat protein 7